MTTSYPLEPHRGRIDGDCQHPLGMGRQLAELLRWLSVRHTSLARVDTICTPSQVRASLRRKCASA